MSVSAARGPSTRGVDGHPLSHTTHVRCVEPLDRHGAERRRQREKLGGPRLQRLDRRGVIDAERTDLNAAQRFQMRGGSDRPPQVAGKRTDVRPGSAGHTGAQEVAPLLQHLPSIDAHRDGGEFGTFPATRHRIRALAAHVLGGKQGRNLLQRAGQRRQRVAHRTRRRERGVVDQYVAPVLSSVSVSRPKRMVAS